MQPVHSIVATSLLTSRAATLQSSGTRDAVYTLNYTELQESLWLILTRFSYFDCRISTISMQPVHSIVETSLFASRAATLNSSGTRDAVFTMNYTELQESFWLLRTRFKYFG
jgi:hypothetical protein